MIDALISDRGRRDPRSSPRARLRIESHARAAASIRRFVLALAAALAGCAERSAIEQSAASGASSTAIADAPRATEAAERVPPAVQDGDSRQADSSSCPSDMLPVQGSYCSKVQQTCLRELGSHRGHPTRSERCLEYLNPSVCEGARRDLRFCIDRFEWPNREGTLPLVLVSWQEASQLCAEAGKRLCTEDEWTFACEGEQMLPYALGHERPANACAIDLAYREPRRPLLPHAACLRDAACSRELGRLDQRRPSLGTSACKSPFGAIDMNGNVNEWVTASAERYPHRGALKGGWWGPVRNRCRPAVLQHRDDHWGYEIGFRCCRNEDDTRPRVP